MQVYRVHICLRSILLSLWCYLSSSGSCTQTWEDLEHALSSIPTPPLPVYWPAGRTRSSALILHATSHCFIFYSFLYSLSEQTPTLTSEPISQGVKKKKKREKPESSRIRCSVWLSLPSGIWVMLQTWSVLRWSAVCLSVTHAPPPPNSTPPFSNPKLNFRLSLKQELFSVKCRSCLQPWWN